MCSIIFSGLILLSQRDRLLWVFEGCDVGHHVFNGLIIRHSVGDKPHLQTVQVISVPASNTIAEVLDLSSEVPVLKPRQRGGVDGPDTLTKLAMALRASRDI